MTERVTFDANILIYSIDSRFPFKQEVAADLVRRGPSIGAMLTNIAAGEFFGVVARKFRQPQIALAHLDEFIELFAMIPYDARHLKIAAQEVVAGRFSFWDAVMLASAEEAGCTICFSEDMGDGARLGAITVHNPFGPRGLNDEARAFLGIDE